jgi:hypothetical protein
MDYLGTAEKTWLVMGIFQLVDSVLMVKLLTCGWV